MISACMAANMRIEQIAELQPAFPTFTEAAQLAAQQVVRHLGIATQPVLWRDPPRHPIALGGGNAD